MQANTSPAIEIDGLSNTERSPAIEMLGLSKTYRPQASTPVHAVVHVSLSAPAGQVVGVLGPNAAGKTTLLKLIAGMVRPTAGHVQVQGHDVVRERALALRQLGVALEGGPPRRSQVSVWQHLLHCGQAMDVGGLELKVRATQLLHELELWDRRDDPLQTYSSTMQRKVALARALLADPPIVVFDEPTLALDERAARRVEQWIAHLAHERGKTVLLTTCQPNLASAICDRVVLLRQGRVVADLPAGDLRPLLRGTQYQIRVKGQLGSQWSEWFDGFTVLPAGGDETILRGTIVDQAALLGLIGKVRDLGLPLLAVSREELSLDDVLTRLIGSAAQRRDGHPYRQHGDQERRHDDVPTHYADQIRSPTADLSSR
jgi:ABC-2 type transport system ATP-binding protein